MEVRGLAVMDWLVRGIMHRIFLIKEDHARDVTKRKA
jgi:hypothetical protein